MKLGWKDWADYSLRYLESTRAAYTHAHLSVSALVATSGGIQLAMDSTDLA